MNNLLTKEQIKAKYNITEDDFDILVKDKEPSPEELKTEEVFLVKLGWYDKFEVWAKKSIVGGVIMAIIFIGGFINGIEKITEYGNIIYTNRDKLTTYIDHFPDYVKNSPLSFLIVPPTQQTEEDRQKQEEYEVRDIFATNTEIYPISGTNIW